MKLELFFNSTDDLFLVYNILKIIVESYEIHVRHGYLVFEEE